MRAQPALCGGFGDVELYPSVVPQSGGVVPEGDEVAEWFAVVAGPLVGGDLSVDRPVGRGSGTHGRATSTAMSRAASATGRTRRSSSVPSSGGSYWGPALKSDPLSQPITSGTAR